MEPYISNTSNRKEIVDLLSTFLAKTYALYLKTQNYHWNAEGPEFYGIHKLLEDHYSELADAIDEIAERIRALGEKAEVSFEMLQKRSGATPPDHNKSLNDMLKDLIAEHEQVIAHAHKGIDRVEELHDHGTADILTGRILIHQKAAWMLQSSTTKGK